MAQTQDTRLNGLTVAILVTDGFEQVELHRTERSAGAGRRIHPNHFHQGRKGARFQP